MNEMTDSLNEAAKNNFSIDYIFPYQRLVISNILKAAEVDGFYDDESEEDDSYPHQIVLLPTGAGKSLCFMLPAVMMKGLTLVIFPLLSLMADQHRRLKEANIQSVILRGGQSSKERDEIFKSCRSESVKMILTNPETALNDSVLIKLKGLKINHLVIDETHIVSEWGETFRPLYMELGRLIEELSIPIITAFTATASPLILSKIKKILFPRTQPNIIYGNPDRTNITYSVIRTISPSRTLSEEVRKNTKPLIVFSSSRTGSELTARDLRRTLDSKNVYFYHAGLSKEEKKIIEAWFFKSDNGVLVATCAYGLGIDKPNIRSVIHIDLPLTVEAYLQESGRSGRDRKKASAILIYNENERFKINRFKDPVSRKRFLSMIDYAEETEVCRREKLLAMLGSEPENCEGCDICHDSVKDVDNEDLILSILKKNRRRLTVRNAVYCLKGFKSREIRNHQLYRINGYGILGDWDTDQIREALSFLLKSEKIRLLKNSFWKGLIH